jgi:hypothetical protein
MCRVSTQIAGKPASATALNNHCDSKSSFQSNLLEVVGRIRQHRQRTSFHHQPEAQHPKSSAIHELPADYPIFAP